MLNCQLYWLEKTAQLYYPLPKLIFFCMQLAIVKHNNFMVHNMHGGNEERGFPELQTSSKHEDGGGGGGGGGEETKRRWC